MDRKTSSTVLACMTSIPVVIVGSEFISYGWHRLASHNKHPHNFIRPTHHKHHVLFNMGDDSHKAYEDFGWIAIALIAAGIVIFGIWDLLFKFSSLLAYLTLTVYLTCVAHSIWKTYIHGAYHTKNHWMEKYAFFREWKRLHLIHHDDPSCNYSISWFIPDYVFGTLERN